MKLVDCESGPYSMSAIITTHVMRDDATTLCGRNVRKGFSRFKSPEEPKDYVLRNIQRGNVEREITCKRCAVAYRKQQAEIKNG